MIQIPALIVLGVSVAVFGGAGLWHALRRRRSGDVEDYVSARGSTGGFATSLTLFASGMGAWLLFSPAEAATWGGVAALIGYSAGSAAPLIVFIFLGMRMRRMIPEGHTLTEYVWYRYGKTMYAATLIVVVSYMFIFLAAEVTGIALIMQLVAGVPLWLTAAAVLLATAAYTVAGGLRTSIFTDKLQTLFILPALSVVVVVGLVTLGPASDWLSSISLQSEGLLTLDHLPGIEGAVTLIIGITAANVFDQGFWQRVYAARDERALRTGFLLAALLVVPVVLGVGIFGLAAVGLGKADVPSVALFSVLMDASPMWLILALVALGAALVMSSVDTLMNGLASLVAVDAKRVLPDTSSSRLLGASQLAVALLALPALLIAAQGFSVLYLFLVADLVCAAAAIPVFAGMYVRRYDGRAALVAMAAGLLAGGLLFPPPDMGSGSLLWSFVAALVVPGIISLGAVFFCRPFHLEALGEKIRLIPSERSGRS